MMTRENGYVFNFNQPILAMYFGQANGTYTLIDKEKWSNMPKAPLKKPGTFSFDY